MLLKKYLVVFNFANQKRLSKRASLILIKLAGNDLPNIRLDSREEIPIF